MGMVPDLSSSYARTVELLERTTLDGVRLFGSQYNVSFASCNIELQSKLVMLICGIRYRNRSEDIHRHYCALAIQHCAA